MIWILAILKQITLEPSNFLRAFSGSVDRGTQVTSDLIIWKMCHIELNYTEEECGNLTSSGFEVIHLHLSKTKFFKILKSKSISDGSNTILLNIELQMKD